VKWREREERRTQEDWKNKEEKNTRIRKGHSKSPSFKSDLIYY
jgi:hypothetical protein